MGKNIIEKIFNVSVKNGYGLKSISELFSRSMAKIAKHSSICESRFFDIKGDSIYCKICRKNLLHFCPLCGSTGVANKGLEPICKNCGFVFERFHIT